MDLKQMEEDLETIKNMPEEELQYVKRDEWMSTDLRVYRESMAKDGGRTWEKLKTISH